MVLFKNKKQLFGNDLMSCSVADCNNDPDKLWSTESNVLDVCQMHYDQLIMENNK